jgi:hypothetical protein
MPFVCDPEYMDVLRGLGERIPGVAGKYGTADPELLAKLYEKSMDVRDKKSQGAFYTPPEIVRFMCRESLTNYISNQTGLSLDMAAAFVCADTDTAAIGPIYECMKENCVSIDRALSRVKIFDPSVGCGAFALGMLEEISGLRKKIMSFFSDERQMPGGIRRKTIAQLLLETVRNNIFAADTDPISVDITTLRLWNRVVSAMDREATGERLYGYGSIKHNVASADSIFEYNGGGFDIVIGNPPYISAVEGAKKNKDIRRALREKFPLLSGAFDIYTAFLLDGMQKTNESGVFCWIIPNKFLVSQYAAPVLEYLKQNSMMKSISISDTGAFTRVGVYPIIICGNKSIIGNKAKKPDFAEYRADSLSDLSKRKFYIGTRPGEYDTFADHSIKIASGAAGFQARNLSRHIITEPENAQDSSGAIPFVVSGCIGRYSIRYEKVRYMGTTYDKAYIAKDKEIAESKWRLWQNEKICIAGLAREIHAYYSRRPLAIGVGTYAIYGFGDFDPLFLLGILNSSFMSRYVNDRFHERHLSSGYLAVSKSMLEQLPIVKADRKTQESIGRNAAKLLELPPDHPEAERLMQDIDEMTDQLYSQRLYR